MLRAVFLVQLALWVSSIHAFYPWQSTRKSCPAGSDSAACSKAVSSRDGRSHQLEARASGPVSTPATAITFELVRKAIRRDQRPAVRAGRAPAQLPPRNVQAGPSRTRSDSQAEDLLENRGTNTYAVATAATPTMSNSAGIDQDGTDFSYFARVAVGSDAQPMYMLLDTGAPTTWVMGSDCTSTACSGHDLFVPPNSTTYQEQKDFAIAYGTGSVSGNLVQDTLSLAGLDVSMTFGMANETSDDFVEFPFDGILGLSWSTGATDNFMAVLEATKKLSASIFSVSLSRSEDKVNDGEITFGAIDPAKYTGALSYTALTGTDGEWAIHMDDIGYDGTSAATATDSRDAYIDTGTSYMFGPPADVAALHKLIPGAASDDDGVTYTVPCSAAKNVTVTFSGVSYDISPLDWMSATGGGGESCVSNIFGHEVVSGAWLLGDVFLKNVYAVFDTNKRRIGLARQPWQPTDTDTDTDAVGTATTVAAGPASSLVKTTTTTTTLPDGSTVTMTVTASTAAGSTAKPGLSGHETAATADGTAAAKTASAATAAGTTRVSGGGGRRMEVNASLLYVLGLLGVAVLGSAV